MNRDNRVPVMGSPNSLLDYVKELQLRKATFRPVTVVPPPSSTVGPWRGTREEIPLFFIPTAVEDLLEFKKSLFYLASKNHKFENLEVLIIFINMILAGFGNMSTRILQTAINSHYTVINYNKGLTEEWINKWDKDYVSRKDYKDIEFTEEIAETLMGIYWNFITRKPNIRQCIEKIKPVYSKACLVDENNQSLETLDPNLRFAEVVNIVMCRWFRMKNEIFLKIQTLSKTSNHELSVISKITMDYFMMAEMEGFAKDVDILSREPKLCFLKRRDNRFEDYNSYNLKSAVNRFLSMGDNAPFCSFTYLIQPFELEIFEASRIQGYIDMANEMIIIEGKPSCRNNQVFQFNDEFLQNCKKVVNLIKATSARHILTPEDESNQFLRKLTKDLKRFKD